MEWAFVPHFYRNFYVFQYATSIAGGTMFAERLLAGDASARDDYLAVLKADDLKLDAPSEIRGEFQPVATPVPGLQICEHMPGLAAIMDKCVALRSVYGSPNGAHDSHICYTGRAKRNEPTGGWPAIGATVAKLKGPTSPGVPPFIGLSPDAGHPPYGSPGLPGFLGVGNAAFRPSGPARNDMMLKAISGDRFF